MSVSRISLDGKSSSEMLLLGIATRFFKIFTITLEEATKGAVAGGVIVSSLPGIDHGKIKFK